MFLVANPLTFALKGLVIATGVEILSFVAWVTFPVLLVCALGGFVAAGSHGKRGTPPVARIEARVFRTTVGRRT